MAVRARATECDVRTSDGSGIMNLLMGVMYVVTHRRVTQRPLYSRQDIKQRSNSDQTRYYAMYRTLP